MYQTYKNLGLKGGYIAEKIKDKIKRLMQEGNQSYLWDPLQRNKDTEYGVIRGKD